LSRARLLALAKLPPIVRDKLSVIEKVERRETNAAKGIEAFVENSKLFRVEGKKMNYLFPV
jgi:ABC-type proline/glycine betaine transport system permease subunit